MLRINLLPVKKIKQRAAAKQQLTLFGFVFAGIVAVLILAALMLSSQASNLQGDITRLEKKEKELAEILKQIEALEKDKELIKKQTAIVEDLEKKSALTVHVMNEVANITPSSQMWLTDFEQSGGTMKITGMVLDNQTVAGYLESLEKSDYIANVTLTNSVMQVYAERNLKKFTLSASAAMPGTEPPAETDEKKAGGGPAKPAK